MVHIQVLRPDNGVGLSRDGVIVKDLLERSGYDVTLTNTQADVLQFRNRKFDINLFMEVIHGKYMRQAKHHVLVPNPEWFPNAWLSYRRRFSKVLCKTVHAIDIFKSRGFNTEFTGFTSVNRYNGTSFDEKRFVFLHAPGKSKLKSTDTVIEAWKRNPHFPTLYLLTSFGNLTQQTKGIDNINYTYGYVREEAFIELQNKALVHVMPSRSEGFGHSIVEPMSTGAIILTTDGKPMNELTADFGYLAKAEYIMDFNLGPVYRVTPESIADQVDKILNEDEEELERRSRRAQQMFVENDRRFKRLFVEAIRSIPL